MLKAFLRAVFLAVLSVGKFVVKIFFKISLVFILVLVLISKVPLLCRITDKLIRKYPTIAWIHNAVCSKRTRKANTVRK